MTTQLTLKHRAILTVSDLSVGFGWIKSIFTADGVTLKRVNADSLTINDIGEKEANILLVSRAEEFNQLNGVLENNQEKLKETTIIILALEYLTPPLYMDIKCTPLKITNTQTLLS